MVLLEEGVLPGIKRNDCFNCLCEFPYKYLDTVDTVNLPLQSHIFFFSGIIDFLVSQHPIAKVLRDHLVFKIAPMLNPDGVYLGNYRYGVEYEFAYFYIYLIYPVLFCHCMASFISFLLKWRFSRDCKLSEVPIEYGDSMANLLASGGRGHLSKIAGYLLCNPPVDMGAKVSLELDLSCFLWMHSLCCSSASM